MGLLSKIKYRRKLYNYFKKIEDFLDNGYYSVDDKLIKKIDPSDESFFKRFKVNSKEEKLFKYKSGSLFFTKYKSGFLTNDKAFYFLNNKNRYDVYKSNYLSYRARLLYPSFNLEFVDDRLLVIGPIVEGTIYKDLSHFDAFLDSLFEYADKNDFDFKIFNYDDKNINLPWYVQHGDCKNANIVWSGNKFTLIDLEAIDLYPPLYDVFYYLFITKKEDSIKVLESQKFQNSVKHFFKMSIKDVPDNILDISLACYANYTVSQLKKGMDLYESEFYLFWRKYDSFKKYPLTKRMLDEYQRKIIEYGLK